MQSNVSISAGSLTTAELLIVNSSSTFSPRVVQEQRKALGILSTFASRGVLETYLFNSLQR